MLDSNLLQCITKVWYNYTYGSCDYSCFKTDYAKSYQLKQTPRAPEPRSGKVVVDHLMNMYMLSRSTGHSSTP